MRIFEKYAACVSIMLLLLACGCGGPKFPWTQSAVIERQPGAIEMPAYPEDGQTVGVNPPGFTWTPNEQAKTYRLEVRRASEASGSMIHTEPLASTVYAHAILIEPGDYASKARTFHVPAGLPSLPMPDIARLKAQLAGLHPRLFLAKNRLAEIKAATAAGRVPWWKPMLEDADAALAEKSYPEPAGYPTAAFSVDDWRRIYTPAKTGSAHVARLALAWQLTGDARYLEGARRWMLAWLDAHGYSEGNDEAAMPILDRMALGWDWVGDKLTPDEKAKVLAAMTERGNQVL